MYAKPREPDGLPAVDQTLGSDFRNHVLTESAESRQNLRRFAFIVFILSLIFRLMMAWRSGFFSHFERDEMVLLALSVATRHGYANPFLIATGPTAHEMPLYPLFLSLIYRILGATKTAEAVKIVVACTVTALRCAMIPLFCEAVQLGRRVAIIAGILSAIYISAVQTELRGNWDGPWQALVVLCLIWSTWRVWTEKSWIGRTPWKYYLLWGGAILLLPTSATILAAFLLPGWILIPQRERFPYFSRCVGLGLVDAFLLAPWAIRNEYALGKVVATRDDFGLECWVSNGPNRAFDMSTNLGFRVPHPSTDVREARKVLQMGEIQYNRAKLIAARNWISENPREFWHLTAVRLVSSGT